MKKTYIRNDFEMQDFTLLVRKDLELIWKWRNDLLIRRWMVNSNPIPYEDHFKFIQSLQTSLTKQQWLVKKDATPVGVVNITSQANQPPELGMYVSPTLLGKGIGSWMLENFLYFLFHEEKLPVVKLEVFANNQPALRLYEKFGFNRLKEKDNVIVMEAKNYGED